MDNELIEKISKAVTEDEAFCKSVASSKSVAEMCGVMASKGFYLTEEEVKAIYNQGISEAEKFKGDEFTAEQLDEVAGGGIGKGLFFGAVSCAAAFGFGCLCGLCPAVAPLTPYVVGFSATLTTAAFLDL